MRLGLGLALTRRSGGSGIVSLSMTGLDTSAPTDAATPGDHLSLSVGFPSGVTAWSSQTWGVGSYGDSTYGTGASPTDYTASDGATLFWEGLGDDGNTYRASAEIRYAEGSVTETGTPFSWTIDDTTLAIDFTSDFTTTNLTGSYVIAGLPTGGVDDTDGSASGTLTGAPASGSFTVTFTDQYGRTIVGNYSYTTSYRTQATGGVDLDLAYQEDSAITPQDLLANWTASGNTLSFVSVSPALPTGLSINSSGTLSGTPTTVTADATYTLTMEDEYGRETSDTFTLEITAAASGDWADNTDWASNGDWAGLAA